MTRDKWHIEKVNAIMLRGFMRMCADIRSFREKSERDQSIIEVSAT